MPLIFLTNLQEIDMSVAEKYAPESLHEAVIPSVATANRINGYATGGLNGHIILYGPNGTGKSTVAHLLPTAISGDDAFVEPTSLEQLLAMKDLKGYLKQSAHVAQVLNGSKYFLVYDEADAVKGNFAKFWTAVDYCGSEVMVIFTTNNPMAIPASIRSRSDEIALPALTPQQFLPRAQFMLQAEGVKLPNAQVLHYLTQIQHTPDIRKYCRKVDEIIFLVNSSLPLPAAPSVAANQPQIKVVAGKKK
jgi:replication-associated recombination protein RarA